jgi:hypothetical protein
MSSSSAALVDGDDFVDTGSYSNALLKSLALIPKFTFVLSIFGSLWIILEVVSEKDKQKLVYHRLLFAFAVVDLIGSIGLFLTTWPMPKDTEDTFWAAGNIATCELQGFLVQFTVALPFYNAMLAFYYMLVIQYNVPEERVKKRYEPFFHAIPLVFSVTTAVAALSTQMYNEANLWCWIAASPNGCLHTQEIDESAQEGTYIVCDRGDGAYIWRWAVYFGPLWLCFLVVLVCLGIVSYGVRQQEIKMARFDPTQQFRAAAARAAGVHAKSPSATHGEGNSTPLSPPPPENKRSFAAEVRRRMSSMTSTSTETSRKPPSRSWQVVTQCICYIMAFYLCNIFSSIVRLRQQLSATTDVVLLILHCFFVPLQGWFNFLIYRRPYYLRMRRKHPLNSRWWVLKKCLEIKQNEKKTGHHEDGLRRCSWSSCRNAFCTKTRASAAAVVDAPTAVMATLSNRLDGIRNSNKLSSWERQLATLAETDVIAAPSVRFSLAEDDDRKMDAIQEQDEEKREEEDVPENGDGVENALAIERIDDSNGK